MIKIETYEVPAPPAVPDQEPAPQPEPVEEPAPAVKEPKTKPSSKE